jgi:hypothetical protein
MGTDVDDKEFLDKLYQLWSKTTGAENTYWDYEEDGLGDCTIRAVDQTGYKIFVANNLGEPDADFVTAIHGCFPDLYRLTMEAMDEAERADYRKDERECRIAELELELKELRADLEGLLG